MSTAKTIKSALISVFHKDGLAPIVQKLNDLNVTIYSTGGTEKFIKELGRLTSKRTKEKQSTSFINAKHLNGDPTWKLCKCLMYNSQPKTFKRAL